MPDWVFSLLATAMLVYGVVFAIVVFRRVYIISKKTALFFSGLAQASCDALATLIGCGNLESVRHASYVDPTGIPRLWFTVLSVTTSASPVQAAQLAKLTQQKELLDAKLDSMEQCPFCDWGCIMEMALQEEGVFRCGNKENGCGVVTCRRCKKKDHSPDVCKLDARLLVEEAMSKALRYARRVLKLAVSVVQQNEVSLVQHAFVLRLPQGHHRLSALRSADAHGRLRPGQQGKCPLFDVEDLEELHRREVAEAQRRATAQYGRNRNTARRVGPSSQATTTGMEQVADEALDAADRLMSSIFESVGLGRGQNLDAAVRDIQIASQDLGRVTRISGPGRVTYTHNGWTINIINQGTGQILVNGAAC
ncbi:hypothetical protein NMY22_g11964 [Coprinellus aureogranulatus]|nr:hypothetical protein NMY22_g11964 [Coprinellus aureogranulatus]